jgi:hypothetical protein
MASQAENDGGFAMKYAMSIGKRSCDVDTWRTVTDHESKKRLGCEALAGRAKGPSPDDGTIHAVRDTAPHCRIAQP